MIIGGWAMLGKSRMARALSRVMRQHDAIRATFATGKKKRLHLGAPTGIEGIALAPVLAGPAGDDERRATRSTGSSV